MRVLRMRWPARLKVFRGEACVHEEVVQDKVTPERSMPANSSEYSSKASALARARRTASLTASMLATPGHERKTRTIQSYGCSPTANAGSTPFGPFFSLIFHGRLADDILAAFNPEPAAVPRPRQRRPQDTSDRATQMLALLQRDGRLVDFLMEDLTAYPDAQIGAAVRDVHSGCRQALARYFTLTPVLDDEEGRTVTIDRGTDAARVKVVGNVTGAPPFRGVAAPSRLGSHPRRAAAAPGTGLTIVAPAEVEIA